MIFLYSLRRIINVHRFTSWSQGEPNHFGDNEHCVEVVERTNWHWNDAPCDAKGRVNKLVCERFEVTSEVIVG